MFISDPQLRVALEGVDMAEVCITSDARVEAGEGPAEAFRMPEVSGVAVVPAKAEGRKCARSWKISPLVGSDPDFPDVTPRDAAALRETEGARPVVNSMAWVKTRVRLIAAVAAPRLRGRTRWSKFWMIDIL